MLAKLARSLGHPPSSHPWALRSVGPRGGLVQASLPLGGFILPWQLPWGLFVASPMPVMLLGLP